MHDVCPVRDTPGITAQDGTAVGSLVGTSVGTLVGSAVGASLGVIVGATVGGGGGGASFRVHFAPLLHVMADPVQLPTRPNIERELHVIVPVAGLQP